MPAHAPPLQVSPAVQALPSSHTAVVLVKTHAPVALVQVSVVQALLSLHVLAAPGTQAPLLHKSPTVQA